MTEQAHDHGGVISMLQMWKLRPRDLTISWKVALEPQSCFINEPHCWPRLHCYPMTQSSQACPSPPMYQPRDTANPCLPCGRQWSLGPRHLPQGTFALWVLSVGKMPVLRAPSSPACPSPSLLLLPHLEQSQHTPSKFSVFPFQWAQPWLWFGCKQLQVPQVIMCSFPPSLTAMSSMFTCCSGL